ncbi:MAG: hypothetical protein WCP17_01090 [bacterium]
MQIKSSGKVLMLGGAFLALSLIAVTAFAEDVTPISATAGAPNTSTNAAAKAAALAAREAKAAAKAADVSAKIACVKVAIAAREAAVSAAVSTHSQAVQAAYTTRTNELAGAYSNTTVKTVQAGVKVAWADFNKTMKAATKAWNTNSNTIWSTYRAAAKACNAPSGVTDGGNSGSEIKGE